MTDKGDYSRFTHKPFKHYTGVLKQQGRVDLDADWNEANEIAAYLRQIEAQDVIGPCGFPKIGGGFEIGAIPQPSLTDNRVDVDLTISPGRGYIDGILCELEATLVPIAELVNGGSDNPTNVVRLSSLTVDGREFQ